MQLLSPQSFFFSAFYFFLLFIMFCTRNFFTFWILIELRTLVFIGISYSLFKNNFSSLLLFFIVQSLSAFSLILFYFARSTLGFTFSLLLKLAIFPFLFWYINLIPMFGNFMFFFSSTMFKLPSIFIVTNFYSTINFSLMFLSAVITVILGATIIISSSDLRFVLVCSSVVNNSWFVFRQYVNRLLFVSYFTVYSLLLLYLLSIINSMSCYSSTLDFNTSTIICLFTIAGLPPFPLFFVKITLVYYLVVNSFNSFYVFFLILLRVITMLGYLKHVFSALISSNFYFVKLL